MEKLTLFWHRRDLRAHDNAGLNAALTANSNVQPIFIFDSSILDRLPKEDKRVDFIHDALIKLDKAYQKLGTRLWVYYGNPLEIYQQLTQEYSVQSLYTNRDYESYAKFRDKGIFEFLESKGIPFIGKKIMFFLRKMKF